MSRLATVSVLGLVWLTIAPFCLSQTRNRRLEDALVDVALLKRVVKEQERRIADLEKTVKTFQVATVANPETPTGGERSKTAAKLPAARWHNPLAWSQIREGMSRAQVEDILGKPTSVDAVMDHQTLVYKGDFGPDVLSGTIKLTDDRLTQINVPEF